MARRLCGAARHRPAVCGAIQLLAPQTLPGAEPHDGTTPAATLKSAINGRTVFHTHAESIDTPDYPGDGKMVQLLQNLSHLTVRGNTMHSTSTDLTQFILVGSLPATTAFSFTRNVVSRGRYGLFSTKGGEGSAALANIVRISENDVDWIAALITHMAKNGQSTAEPTQQAEDAWMQIVYTLAQRTLLSKAKTWYVGANVAGKAQGLSLFTGGFPKYREYCTQVIQNGWRDLAFTQADSAVPA